MSERIEITEENTTGSLAAEGYLPAIAAKYLAEGKHSRVVELCKEHLDSYRHLLSITLIYGRALFHAGQYESSEEQFYNALARDPDNIVAMKYLGDIRFLQGDEMAAMANYRRILEIDPDCRGLSSDISGSRKKESTKTIKLVRPDKSREVVQQEKTNLTGIKFYTETMGDLYLNQGHSRLASEVFETLLESNDNPRINRKLIAARKKVKEKEDRECQQNESRK